MAFNDEGNEGIPYRSPVELTPRGGDVPPEDEKNFSTLRELLKIVKDFEGKAHDTDSVDLSHPKLSAEEQLHGLQFAIDHLFTPFRTAVEGAVKNVRAQNSGEES